jgi:hypothetical protein
MSPIIFRLELWVGGPLPTDFDRTLAGRQVVRLPDLARSSVSWSGWGRGF